MHYFLTLRWRDNKMKSKSINKLYTLHCWVGTITGILLFVIAFTGAVSVFGRPEIKLWSNPEIRSFAPADTLKIERLIEEYSHQVPEHYKEEVLVFYRVYVHPLAYILCLLFAVCCLVYTGFTLSWRRLVYPYLKRRRRKHQFKD